MDCTEFFRLCEQKYLFLVEEYGFHRRRKRERDSYGCKMIYKSPLIAVEIFWEFREEYVFVSIAPMSDRRTMPGSIYLRTLEPRVYGERIPPRVRSGEFLEADLAKMVEGQAVFLSEYGKGVLSGDFRQASKTSRMLRDWKLEHLSQPTLRNPEVGDVFELRMCGQSLVGRVMRDDACVGEYGTLCLLYVYEPGLVDPQHLTGFNADKLLIPPLVVYNLPWGYFRIIGKTEITSADMLPGHCFEDSAGRLHDEYGQLLDERVGTCGIYGIINHGMLNHLLSDAMSCRSSSG